MKIALIFIFLIFIVFLFITLVNICADCFGSGLIVHGRIPSDEARLLIQSQINNPSEFQTVRNVTFSPKYSLNAKAIATASGVITDDQICISAGDYATDSRFKFSSNGGVLTYEGVSNISANLSVICDTGNQLQDDLSIIGNNASTWPATEKCNSVVNPDSRRPGCIIVIQAK